MTRARSVLLIAAYGTFLVGFCLLFHQNINLRRQLAHAVMLIERPGAAVLRGGDSIGDLILVGGDGSEVEARNVVAGGNQIVYFYKPDCEICRRQDASWHEYLTQYGVNDVLFVNCDDRDSALDEKASVHPVRKYRLRREAPSKRIDAVPQLVRVNSQGVVVTAYRDVDSLLLEGGR